MADNYGLSFAPLSNDDKNGGSPPTPLQSAIQTLSYRIPKFSGGAPIAANPLLQGQGMGGVMGQSPTGGFDLESFLRMILMGMGQPGQMGGGAPMGAAGAPAPAGMPPTIPTPHFTPGGQQPSAEPTGDVKMPQPTFNPAPTPVVDRSEPATGNRQASDVFRPGPWTLGPRQRF